MSSRALGEKYTPHSSGQPNKLMELLKKIYGVPQPTTSPNSAKSSTPGKPPGVISPTAPGNTPGPAYGASAPNDTSIDRIEPPVSAPMQLPPIAPVQPPMAVAPQQIVPPISSRQDVQPPFSMAVPGYNSSSISNWPISVPKAVGETRSRNSIPMYQYAPSDITSALDLNGGDPPGNEVPTTASTWDPNAFQQPFQTPSLWRRMMGDNSNQLNAEAKMAHDKEVFQYNASKALEQERVNQAIRERQTLQPWDVGRQQNVPMIDPRLDPNNIASSTIGRTLEPRIAAITAEDQAKQMASTLARHQSGLTDEALQSARSEMLSPLVRANIIGADNSANKAQLEGQDQAQMLENPIARNELYKAKMAHETAATQAPTMLSGTAYVDPVSKEVRALPSVNPNLYTAPSDVVQGANRAESLGKAQGENAATMEMIKELARQKAIREGKTPADSNITPPVSKVNAMPRAANSTKSTTGANNKTSVNTPTTSSKGWILHVDANGNKAYVGPKGEIEQVK